MRSVFHEYIRLISEDASDIDKIELEWMWFHVSSKDLGDEFTFTPRIPRNPYQDINQDTIEDTRTPRTSWAPSIRKALDALGTVYVRNAYIYAVHDLPGEVNIQDEFEECPGNAGNEYGPDFIWKRYEDYVEKLTKKDLGPADKADELEKCVPDVRDTEEQWATASVKGRKVGVISNGKIQAL